MSEPLILLEGVEKAYRFFRLTNLGMRLDAGQILGLVGPNGAGTSTPLRIVMAMVQQGYRAVLLFCVQHTGIEWVEPADGIDPVYGKHLRDALAMGVEVIAYQANISPSTAEITLVKKLPVRVD